MADLLIQRGHFNLELIRTLLAGAVDLCIAHGNPFEIGLQVRDHHIVTDAQTEEQAGQLAVLRDHDHAAVNGISGAGDLYLLTLQPDIAAVGRIIAKQRFHDLGASRADQSGKAQNLTPVD